MVSLATPPVTAFSFRFLCGCKSSPRIWESCSLHIMARIVPAIPFCFYLERILSFKKLDLLWLDVEQGREFAFPLYPS